MRYIFISDVHGEYDKMVRALEQKKFNPVVDTLVTLGDLFDRGPDSLKVLEYVMSVPNCIKVWGNHDRRLRELLLGQAFNECDKSNGVPATLQSFTSGIITTRNSDSPSDARWMITQLKTDSRLKRVYDLLWKYFDECVWALEFNDMVATHAWVPTIQHYSYDEYWPEWRMWANTDAWDSAVWTNVNHIFKGQAFLPDKKLLVGHWHSWRIAYVHLYVDLLAYNKETHQYEFTPAAETEMAQIRECNNTIFIDGCANHPWGDVLAYVYESSNNPIIYEKNGAKR